MHSEAPHSERGTASLESLVVNHWHTLNTQISPQQLHQSIMCTTWLREAADYFTVHWEGSSIQWVWGSFLVHTASSSQLRDYSNGGAESHVTSDGMSDIPL